MKAKRYLVRLRAYIYGHTDNVSDTTLGLFIMQYIAFFGTAITIVSLVFVWAMQLCGIDCNNWAESMCYALIIFIVWFTFSTYAVFLNDIHIKKHQKI